MTQENDQDRFRLWIASLSQAGLFPGSHAAHGTREKAVTIRIQVTGKTTVTAISNQT